MSNKPHLLTSCFHELPSGDDDTGSVPEWIHLIPAKSGGTIQTHDERGPFTLGDAQAFIKRSMEHAGGKLAIDENHSIDHAGPKGAPSPARGWIVEMEERDTGIWGRVEWNNIGRGLLEDRAYRGISPVIANTKDKEMRFILRASLVNTPNLRELVALHMENKMNWFETLIDMLDLPPEATDEDVKAALQKMMGKSTDEEVAAHAVHPDIAKALGLDDDAALDVALNAITSIASDDDTNLTAELHATQTKLAGLTAELHALKTQGLKDRATAFVDGAIKEGRPGVRPRREAYIERHMKDPTGTEADIQAMPILTGEVLSQTAHAFVPDFDMTDAGQIEAHARKYQKKMADEGAVVSYVDAVTHVTEGSAK